MNVRWKFLSPKYSLPFLCTLTPSYVMLMSGLTANGFLKIAFSLNRISKQQNTISIRIESQTHPMWYCSCQHLELATPGLVRILYKVRPSTRPVLSVAPSTFRQDSFGIHYEKQLNERMLWSMSLHSGAMNNIKSTTDSCNSELNCFLAQETDLR